VFSYPRKDNALANDRIRGASQQAKGTVKEVAGRVSGDAKLQAEREAEKVAAKT
jgi:uncharacterized protein YjbJ (UPF0337 family)